MKRTIIRIDEDLCDGCGDCIMSCAEGALALVDGKAKLVSEIYCDGLGACLAECPQGALTLEDREADEFDEEAVEEHLASQMAPARVPRATLCGGPGSAARELHPAAGGARAPGAGPAPSALSNWPIQIHLAPPQAPYFQGATLLVAADCVPGAYPDFHADMLAGRKLLIGCPKLDDGRAYLEKLTAICQHNDLKGVEIAFMEVPCCTGLVHLVQQAVRDSGSDVPVRMVQVGIDGQIRGRSEAAA